MHAKRGDWFRPSSSVSELESLSSESAFRNRPSFNITNTVHTRTLYHCARWTDLLLYIPPCEGFHIHVKTGVYIGEEIRSAFILEIREINRFWYKKAFIGNHLSVAVQDSPITIFFPVSMNCLWCWRRPTCSCDRRTLCVLPNAFILYLIVPMEQ